MSPLKRTLPVLSLFAVLHFTVPAQTISTLPVDGATVSFREYGKGDPLVIVGGLTGASNDYLVPLAEEFGKHYRTILIDMRGTGGSTINRLDTGNVCARRVASDLEMLRGHLKLKNWIVVGHAWGGTVALTYAGLYPNGIRGLLLIGPAGIDLRFLDYYNLNIGARMNREDSALFNQWRNVSRWSPQRPKAMLEQFRATLGGYVVERKVLPALRAAINEHSYVSAVAEVYWSAFINNSPPIPEMLRTFKAPSLIIQGDKDPVDQRTADRIRKSLKAARYKEIKACGSFPWLEKPKDFWSAANVFLKNLKK
jgi:proline iminopeptidase